MCGTGSIVSDPKTGILYVKTCGHNLYTYLKLKGMLEAHSDAFVFSGAHGSAYLCKCEIITFDHHPDYAGTAKKGADMALGVLGEAQYTNDLDLFDQTFPLVD